MTFIISFIDRKVRLAVALLAMGAVCLGLSGCGSSTSSVAVAKTSGIKKRVLVSNQTSSILHLIDAQNDAFATSIAVTSPTRMITQSGVTAVVDATTNTVALLDNPTEAVKVQPALAGHIDDLALSNDGKTAYAVMRNLSQLAIINVPDGTFVTVAIPGVSRLVLGPNSGKLLAFSDDAQHLPSGNANAMFIVDTASHSVFTLNGDAGVQPYSAVFNGSDAQAFVLNCGTECGGTAAPSIRPLNLSGTPTWGAPIPLPAGAGATAGLLNGSNLFLAGTATAGSGSLVVFNTSANSFSPVLSIQDGLHTRMAMTSNGRLFVGSTNCVAVPVGAAIQGCLAILDTAKGIAQSSLVFPAFSGFRTSFSVTGMQPISGRNVIYIIEGGELDIFDITTSALSAKQIDVVGHAVDVVQIDP